MKLVTCGLQGGPPKLKYPYRVILQNFGNHSEYYYEIYSVDREVNS